MIYEFAGPFTGTSKEPYRSLLQRLLDRYGRDPIPVFLVPDTDNKYDPNAVQGLVQTSLGREVIGLVASRRFCPLCDPDRRGRGHKAYNTPGDPAPNVCPETAYTTTDTMGHEIDVPCGADLTWGAAERMAPLLQLPDAEMSATVVIVGGEGNKANLGAWYRAKITVPDDSVGVL